MFVTEEVRPQAINETKTWIMLTDGQIVPVVKFLDWEGDECHDFKDAVSIVAGHETVGFWSMPADIFDVAPKTVH